MENTKSDGAVKLRKRRKKKRRDVIVFISVLFAFVATISFIFSPWCHVGNLQVSGNRSLSVEDVCRSAQIDLPMNIFLLNPSLVAERLKKDLRIASVEVERVVWPPTLVVKITENAIMAYAVSDYGIASLDKNGVVIAAQKVFSGYYAPLIAGAVLTDEYVGEKARNKLVADSASFLARLDDVTFDQISEVNLSNPKEVFLLMNDGMIVRLGEFDRQEEKAKHLKQMIKEIAEKNFAISQLDLKYEPPTMRVKK